jgi:hypothetical protein
MLSARISARKRKARLDSLLRRSGSNSRAPQVQQALGRDIHGIMVLRATGRANDERDNADEPAKQSEGLRLRGCEGGRGSWLYGESYMCSSQRTDSEKEAFDVKTTRCSCPQRSRTRGEPLSRARILLRPPHQLLPPLHRFPGPRPNEMTLHRSHTDSQPLLNLPLNLPPQLISEPFQLLLFEPAFFAAVESTEELRDLIRCRIVD